MFLRDGPEDLILRGFSRSEIIDKISVDVGYKNCKFRGKLRGIDRRSYQLDYVAGFDHVLFLSFLEQYADGRISRFGFWNGCGLGTNCLCSVEMLCSAQGVSELYSDISRRAGSVRGRKACATVRAKYGVSSPGLIPGSREKGLATLMAKFGTTNVMSLPEIKEKCKATCRERFGVDYSGQAESVKEKRIATSRARYNCDNPMQCQAIQERQRAAVRASLGVDTPMEAESVRKKVASTNLLRYGHTCALCGEAVIEKTNSTSVKKYGMSLSEYLRSDSVVNKRKATCNERYGGDYPFSSADVQEKGCLTRLRKYGYRHLVSSPEFIERRRKIFLEKYNVEFVWQIPGVRDKGVATLFENWGVQNPLQSAEIRKMRSDTMFAKTGYHWPMQNPVVKDKMLATKLKNGTFCASKAEDALYEKLVGHFGSDDVIRQHSSELYPYACDFYIKSRHMYIELNGFATHGGHWFGSCASDVVLYENAKQWGESVCGYNDHTWAVRDVVKRETARKNNLNYVVFWGDLGQDADLWFALGCPDGHDWEREYSWIPDRALYYDGAWPKNLTLGSGVVSAAAHMANWRIFYEGEIALWNKRYDSKWGTIPVRLYSNRLKYLNKDIRKLTNRDVLRGLNISGMYHGYSSYNNSGMVEFLEKYKPNFVYDPCAGWGERMLTCAASGIQYLGVDINKRLMPGYLRLMRHYNLDNVGLIHGDSSKIDLSHGQQDCVFTCPPYEGFEIYTEFGAENLSHDDFINWWQSVVQHSVGPNTRIFAYQINQSCKSDMNQVLLDAGWRLDSQIPVNVGKISHLSKSKGVKKKKNFEEIQVFVRDI